MPNKYYLREDRTAVSPTDEEPEMLVEHTDQDLMLNQDNLVEWERHLRDLPALTVDPAYLETLSPGWFEGVERYEEFRCGRWIKTTEGIYNMLPKTIKRLTIIAPQEAEKEDRILYGNTSGVCYNCLNGFHKGCDIKNCTCKQKDHKAWWWRTQSEIDVEQNKAYGVFQSGVKDWLLSCFGEEISNDIIERNHRFFEEAAELVQATGCTKSECHQLVDYVFDRPKGDPVQEVGGVLVTLSALCSAANIDMEKAGQKELARIWTKVEKIRAKQAAKPKHSPLPATPQPVTGDAGERSKPVKLVAIVTDAVICGQNNIGINGDYIGYGVKDTVSSVLEKHGLLKELDTPTCDNCKSDFHSCDCGQWSPVYPQPYLAGASSMQAEVERLRDALEEITEVSGPVGIFGCEDQFDLMKSIAIKALNKQ